MRCNNCKKILPEDSKFCHYCGCKIDLYQNVNSTYGYVNNNYGEGFSGVHTNTTVQPWEKKKSSFARIIVVVFAILIGIIIISSLMEESESELKPVVEPKSGEILMGYEDDYGSKITIETSDNEACVVKLKTSSGATRLSFYVRAGDVVTIGVPCESLYVYFASGDTWYGDDHLFGEDTSYYMDDNICDFSEYTLEYTLYPMSSGNFSQTPIDEDEFK